MKYTAIALLVVLLSVSTFGLRAEKEYRDSFVSYMREHQKVYRHDEFQTRYATYKSNLDIIDEYNTKQNSFTLAMNKFGDLPKEEFKRLFLGLNTPNQQNEVVELSTGANPDSVDWRKHNAVTPVKNQGQCGSCWAFSTTGSLEGLNAIKKGSLLSFSEQQLVDCSTGYNNNGCNGGLMDNAFKYVADKGIELESVYPPYTAQDGSCRYDANKVAFKNTGYKDVPSNTPSQLETAVANHPVSIAIEADQSCFQFYSSGILNDASCGTQLDHGVLIVGYGSQSGTPYWIVKNSWGASWGNQGYIWIAKDKKDGGAGICGINSMPSYPTL